MKTGTEERTPEAMAMATVGEPVRGEEQRGQLSGTEGLLFLTEYLQQGLTCTLLSNKEKSS